MRRLLRLIVRLVRAIRRLKSSADFYFHSYPPISEEKQSCWTSALFENARFSYDLALPCGIKSKTKHHQNDLSPAKILARPIGIHVKLSQYRLVPPWNDGNEWKNGVDPQKKFWILTRLAQTWLCWQGRLVNDWILSLQVPPVNAWKNLPRLNPPPWIFFHTKQSTLASSQSITEMGPEQKLETPFQHSQWQLMTRIGINP